MAVTDWNPDTGGRSLAEILREAGLESAARAKRRRSWDDPEETALRQRRAEAAADMSNRSGYGRRRSDLEDSASLAPVRDRPAAREVRDVREARDVRAPREFRDQREARDQRGAADQREGRDQPEARDQRGPRALRDLPGARRESPAARAPAAPRETPRQAESPARREARGLREASAPRRPLVADPSTAAIPGIRPDRKPGVPGPSAAPDRTPPQRPAAAHPLTGPIPVVGAEGFDAAEAHDLEDGPRESALAWLRFAGELIIALGAGVGIYFAATVLWEMVPYLAVLLVPVAVTGLVAGVGAWRHRMGHESVGPRLLAVLVFAGTLLTVVPAAQVLAGG